MNLKSLVIKTNDFVCYIAFFITLVWTTILALAGEIVGALVIGVGGFVICSLVFGLWVAISQIAVNSEKQTEILKKILEKTV